MIRASLLAQTAHAWRCWSLRGAALGMVAVMALGQVSAAAQRPEELVLRLTWLQLLASLVIGACLVGWRVAQFPKSRAAEFHLVTPAADWQIILGEILGGAVKTVVVSGATLPFIAAMLGAGWIRLDAALAVFFVPLAGGLTAGLALAVAAYEPRWVRAWFERLTLLAILVYLVTLGLLGDYFLPIYVTWRARLSVFWDETLLNSGDVLRYLNPFALLGDVGGGSGSSLACALWRS